MSKYTGTKSIGIKLPIIRKGDDLQEIVFKTLLDAEKEGEIKLQDRDVVAITESLVARAQGNYATVDDIAQDIINKIGKNKTICVIHPILSRNRFSILLKGIAKAAGKVILILSYPSDEVGNALLSWDTLDMLGIDPHIRLFDLETYRKTFGKTVHEFTGIDYIEFYKELIESQNAACDIYFSNNVSLFCANRYRKEHIDAYIAADIHTRARTKNILKKAESKNVFGLDDILTSSLNGSGFNKKYGLLGSNKATEDTVKLFPNNAQNLVDNLQKKLLKATGKHIHVMVYGDGAFKDPQGKIWELADPVVSPFHTADLIGTPNEVKLKYLADDKFKDKEGDILAAAIKEEIKQKDKKLVGKMISEGTTPRQLTDLLGSLADLTSGSGDKGTPVVLIQNYFSNYASD